jgi:Tfp pilus assembly protein PilE
LEQRRAITIAVILAVLVVLAVPATFVYRHRVAQARALNVTTWNDLRQEYADLVTQLSGAAVATRPPCQDSSSDLSSITHEWETDSTDPAIAFDALPVKLTRLGWTLTDLPQPGQTFAKPIKLDAYKRLGNRELEFRGVGKTNPATQIVTIRFVMETAATHC